MYFVYILSNWSDSVLYIGVTNNLPRRLYEHRNHLADGFTKRYNVSKLVYYESTSDVRSAIAREKQLKGWTRAKKNSLISKANPNWRDLSKDWESYVFLSAAQVPAAKILRRASLAQDDIHLPFPTRPITLSQYGYEGEFL